MKRFLRAALRRAGYRNSRNDQPLFQIAGYPVPTERNVGLMKALYGIDADRDTL